MRKKVVSLVAIFATLLSLTLNVHAENYDRAVLTDNEKLIEFTRNLNTEKVKNAQNMYASVSTDASSDVWECFHLAPKRYEYSTYTITGGISYCYCVVNSTMEFCTTCQRLTNNTLTYTYTYNHSFTSYGSNQVRCTACGLIGNAAR